MKAMLPELILTNLHKKKSAIKNSFPIRECTLNVSVLQALPTLN